MWVARDKSGELRFFSQFKPSRMPEKDIWENLYRMSVAIDPSYPNFKDLKWEDDPVEVVVVRKDEWENKVEQGNTLKRLSDELVSPHDKGY